MALLNEQVKQQYNLTGGLVNDYPIPFPYWGEGEIYAVLTKADGNHDLENGVDYSVSTPDGVSGTLTRLTGWNDGLKLTIYRELPLTQETDLANGGVMDAEVMELMTDRAIASLQQMNEKLDRVIRSPITEGALGELPPEAERRNMLLGFDGDGEFTPIPYTNQGINADSLPLGTAVVTAARTIPNTANTREALQAVVDDLEAADAAIEQLVEDEEDARIAAVSGVVGDLSDHEGAADAHITGYIGAMIRKKVEDCGLTWDQTDPYLLEKADIGMSKKVGELIYTDASFTPVSLSNSRSVANPSNPEYNPIVARHDTDKDISTTHTSQAVIDFFRSIRVNALGTTEFAVTVTGNRIQFPATTPAQKAVAAMLEANLVNRWFSSGESATYADSGANYSSPRNYCINIAGVDHTVSNVNVVSNFIDVVTTPASGAQTAIIYPHRIAGSTTSFRLRRVSGQVPVAAGDATGEVLIGLARMDRFMSHWHRTYGGSGAATTNLMVRNATGSSATADYSGVVGAREPTTDDVNGTPRHGKTTDPRAYGVGVYTHVRVLLQEV